MKINRSNKEQGFTLVELLVALMLVSFLCIVLFAALRLGSETSARVIVEQQDVASFLDVQGALSHWLADAYPKFIFSETSSSNSDIAFDGEPSSVTFITHAPSSISPAGMALMHVGLEKSGTQSRLMVSAQAELSTATQNTSTEEVLLTQVANIDFSYFGQGTGVGKRYWQRSWKDRMYLPDLIRINVTFVVGSLQQWPVLIIAPKILVDQGCEYIAATQSCLGR